MNHKVNSYLRKASLIGLAFLIGFSFAVVGCSGDDDDRDDGGNNNGNGVGSFSKIKIVGGNQGEPPATVAVGSFTTLAAIPTDDDGKAVPPDAGDEYWTGVTWKSSDPSVATVLSQPGGASAGAAVQALKPGKTTITAIYKNMSGSVTITVQ